MRPTLFLNRASAYLYLGILLLAVQASFFLLHACRDSSSNHTTITENDIRTMMQEVEAATLGKDLDGIMKHLAPFVVITVSMETPYGLQRIQMTRDQYREELKKTFAGLSHYEYEHDNDQITVAPDGRTAITETVVTEVLVVDGQESRTTTREKVYLEIVDGEILVSRIDGTIRALDTGE
ncbi:MAG: hypothetical protein ACOYVJ_02865 [Nitrospirota bacterium]